MTVITKTRSALTTSLLAGVMALTLTGAHTALAQTSITVAQSGDAQPRNILPTRGGNLPWLKNVFETLTVTDPITFEPQPLLATSWEIAEDGLSIHITLRDDVTFHTGRRMTADDVRFTFETAADPATAAQTGFIAREFTSIDVLSDTELRISFASPLANIFDFFEDTSILDQETYANREDGSQVIGTGPYRFASWTPGASIMLERYDGYRDADAAQIDQIEFAVINDPTAMISALRSGRASVGFNMTPRDTIEFSGSPQYTIEQAGGAIFPLGVNVTLPPFDNVEVRRAVGYAIDRERINDQVFDGSGTPTALFWSPSSPGYSVDLANAYAYDPDRARAMIDAAGATGAEIQITLPAIPANRGIFEIVQNNLREVGLVPVGNVLDVPTYDQLQIAGDLGQAFALIHGQVGFGSATLLSSLPSLRAGNPSQFWTPEYEALRMAVEAATTTAQTAAAVEALSAYMIDQAFTLALVQSSGLSVISNSVSGVGLSRRGHLLLSGATLEN
ncbi:MAG: ABC transporter substrate-binding protein [Rhodobacteraceae bacterium]|nr:ABC transporter substrate-binding protein [Paracoccaceae bacterium]